MEEPVVRAVLSVGTVLCRSPASHPPSPQAAMVHETGTWLEDGVGSVMSFRARSTEAAAVDSTPLLAQKRGSICERCFRAPPRPTPQNGHFVPKKGLKMPALGQTQYSCGSGGHF